MPTKLHLGPVYGPVHNRRFGVSLGVNLMPTTGKICTFDCLYCEDGLNAERRTHDGCVGAEALEAALEAKLEEMSAQGVLPDVITFSGNGEPTAAPSFPDAVRAAVRLRDAYAPDCRIAVLSNATLADRPAVREAWRRPRRDARRHRRARARPGHPLPGVVLGGDGAWSPCRKLRKVHDSYRHKMRAPDVRGAALPGLAFAGPGNFH